MQSELVDRGIEFLADVEKRIELLLKQRRVWEIRESDSPEQQTSREWESLEAGKMWIDREFRPALDEEGLSQFESMMATTQGKLLRALPDRENWRLELHAPHATPRGAYLKKHHIRTWQSWWRAKVGAGPGNGHCWCGVGREHRAPCPYYYVRSRHSPQHARLGTHQL